MIKAADGTEICENQIEELFRQYCEDNGALKIDDHGNATANPVKATVAWKYIYNQLFKPQKKMYQNRKSKLDYDNIESIYSVLDIYLDICALYDIPPYLTDFCRMTGISYDTVYSWSHDEYGKDGNVNTINGEHLKYSDILKRIRTTAGEMLEKNMYRETIGRQSLANNSRSFGLLYNKQNIKDQAAAQITVRSAAEIAESHRKALELPEAGKLDI